MTHLTLNEHLSSQGTNAMILGSGIQILEGALAKALDEGVTTPTFIEELDVKVCVKHTSKL